MADAVARHEAGDDVAGSASGAVSLRDVLNVHQIARSDIFVGVSIKSKLLNCKVIISFLCYILE